MEFIGGNFFSKKFSPETYEVSLVPFQKASICCGDEVCADFSCGKGLLFFDETEKTISCGKVQGMVFLLILIFYPVEKCRVYPS